MELIKENPNTSLGAVIPDMNSTTNQIKKHSIKKGQENLNYEINRLTIEMVNVL